MLFIEMVIIITKHIRQPEHLSFPTTYSTFLPVAQLPMQNEGKRELNILAPRDPTIFPNREQSRARGGGWRGGRASKGGGARLLDRGKKDILSGAEDTFEDE